MLLNIGEQFRLLNRNMLLNPVFLEFTKDECAGSDRVKETKAMENCGKVWRTPMCDMVFAFHLQMPRLWSSKV